MRAIPQKPCLSLVHGFEGSAGTWERTRTQDPGGLWEIGWSHRLTGPDDPLWNHTIASQGEADTLALSDLGIAAQGVCDALGDVVDILTDNQYAALIDFTYNEGVAAFTGSQLCRLVKEGNMTLAYAQFPVWDKGHVGGVLVTEPGLLRRRKAEQFVWNSPVV